MRVYEVAGTESTGTSAGDGGEMKKAVECIGRVLEDTLMMAVVMVLSVVFISLQIIADIFKDE